MGRSMSRKETDAFVAQLSKLVTDECNLWKTKIELWVAIERDIAVLCQINRDGLIILFAADWQIHSASIVRAWIWQSKPSGGRLI